MEFFVREVETGWQRVQQALPRNNSRPRLAESVNACLAADVESIRRTIAGDQRPLKLAIALPMFFSFVISSWNTSSNSLR